MCEKPPLSTTMRREVDWRLREANILAPVPVWEWVDRMSVYLGCSTGAFIADLMILSRQAHNWGTECAIELPYKAWAEKWIAEARRNLDAATAPLDDAALEG